MTDTTRLGLYLPTNSEVVNVLTAISDQMDQIDELAFVTECTSSTRPVTDLYTGRLIYETNTKDVRRWSGSGWILLSNINRPRGKIGFVTTTAASANVATNAEIGPLLSITFTYIAGRQLAIYFGGNIDVTTGNDAPAAYRIRRANGASVTTSGTLMESFGADANDNTTTTSTRTDGFLEFTSVANQITIGLFLARPNSGDAKTVASVSYQYLAIEDVGA